MRDSKATFDVTDESFSEDVLNSKTPVLVDVWADWCGPCKAIAPVLEELAADKAGELRVAKLDADAYRAVARDYDVASIPTMILFKDGKPVTRIIGAQSKSSLLRRLAEHI